MKKVALKVAYIGTHFHGFQRQPDVRTVEGELINALKEAKLIEDLNKARFAISGRTDRGVHALGNVISFMSENEVIINQINDILPPDIQILAKAPVHYGFKPRYASKRHYRYIIVEENFLNNNINCNYNSFNQNSLNLRDMQEASTFFEGTHNFANFSKRSERNPVRAVDEVNVFREGSLVLVDVVGESFLWNMVRKMVKTLLDVGKGSIQPSTINEFLNPKNDVPIKPMPPECLILMDVEYPKLRFKYDEYACSRFQSTLNEELIKHQTSVMIEKTMIEGINSICTNNKD